MEAKNYFSLEEQRCHCGCSNRGLDPAFLKKLNHIRATLGKPLVLTSAYRCPDRNAAESVTGEDGPHTTGRAVDIHADSRLRSLVQREAMKLGMTRFGIAQSFIHIDDLNESDGFDSNVTWVYGK